MVAPETHVYATAPHAKGARQLELDFYPAGTGADLMLFLHSGGFRGGSRIHKAHPKIAAAFAEQGIATAFLDYRLARPQAVLRPATRALQEALIADARAAGEVMHETFYGPRALAVVEDACAALGWAEDNRARLGVSGRYILAGSSAGAISALNTLYLPRALGLDRPEIATVFAFSGGFAYPSYWHATGARILALASENDARVPPRSIRRLAAEGPDRCILLEHPDHGHGDLHLPGERRVRGIRRAVAFHRAEAAELSGFAHPAPS